MQGGAEALVIHAPVQVAPAFFRLGLLVPLRRLRPLPLLVEAVSNLVQGGAEALVIHAPVQVALAFFRLGLLVPGKSNRKSA